MYSIVQYDKQSWKELSQKSFIVVFGEDRTPDLDRIDFVLGIAHNDEIGGFVTIKEMDAETAYIQHGGVYPNYEKSIHVIGGYKKMLANLSTKYKFIWTRIENLNLPMLKMALACGFIITGVSNFNGRIYLELNLGG